jgi:23S rRNA pseudouridine955/2504/2580 synthase
LQAKSITVGEDDAGQRLDNFLVRCLKGVPKTHIYRIVRSGEVRVNMGRASAETRLGAGDVVRIPPLRTSVRAQEKGRAMATGRDPVKDFAVLFEDDFLLAIDKPAGIAVHGGSGVSFGVIEQLRMARPQARFLELVHRLDRETSGILLVAKKRSALKNLQDQFRDRETGKVYLALVLGQWNPARKVLDRPLQKYLQEGAQQTAERRVRVVAREDPDARAALTLVRLRASAAPAAAGAGPQDGFSLLEVTIKTGRTHQIRVHLAAEGQPIAGDDKYGNFERNRELSRAGATPALKRMFLHAWRLRCNHPASGEALHLFAPLPPELVQFLASALPDALTSLQGADGAIN